MGERGGERRGEESKEKKRMEEEEKRGGGERARRDARRDRGWAPQVEEKQSANDGRPRKKRAKELDERRKNCADG